MAKEVGTRGVTQEGKEFKLIPFLKKHLKVTLISAAAAVVILGTTLGLGMGIPAAQKRAAEEAAQSAMTGQSQAELDKIAAEEEAKKAQEENEKLKQEAERVSVIELTDAQVQTISNEIKGAKTGTVTNFKYQTFTGNKDGGKLGLYFDGKNGFDQSVIYRMVLDTTGNKFSEEDVLNMIREQAKPSDVFVASSQMDTEGTSFDKVKDQKLSVTTFTANGEVKETQISFNDIALQVNVQYNQAADTTTVNINPLVATDTSIIDLTKTSLTMQGRVSQAEANSLALDKVLEMYLSQTNEYSFEAE